MRVGIWCDYGMTLGPSEGIGVFVDSLARGLIAADSAMELVVMANPNDYHLLDPLVAAGAGRIRREVNLASKSFWARFVGRTTRWLERVNRAKAKNKIAAKVLRLCGVATTLRWLIAMGQSRVNREMERAIDQCDLWLLPYVGLEAKFRAKKVVVIHDLVCFHFPQMWPPEVIAHFRLLVDEVAANSTMATCMSQFICKNDLVGQLNLPTERIRVLRSAVPGDLEKHLQGDRAQGKKWIGSKGLEGRYLFYPAAFRPYKNHEFLVEALSLLQQRGDADWKLVFTGLQNCPESLAALIQQLGLGDRVVILKQATREQLVWLYQHAFATVVPSRYEQGSFPVMEALACKCPVISSGIESLREQFASLGDAMLYVDPDRPVELLPHLDTIERERQQLIERQSEGFKKMREFTWVDAARDWIKVFEETLATPDDIATYRAAKNHAADNPQVAGRAIENGTI